MREIDVFTLGETMLRLTPRGYGRLEESSELEIRTGGSESNVAVALVVLGLRVEWASRLPRNALGRIVARRMAGLGVGTRRLAWCDEGRMGLYFIETGAPPRPGSVLYDRSGSAASMMTPADWDWSYLREARHVHLGGITPALGPGPAAVVAQAMAAAREYGCTISFDINYRSRLWSPATATAALEPLTRGVDLLIATSDDARTLFGMSGEGPAVSAELRRRLDTPIVALTLGGDGALIDNQGEVHTEAPFVVQAIDRVGAGDAFAAGAIWGFLNGDLAAGCRYGTAMAALKHTLHGDELVASREEIEAVLTRGRADISR